MRKNIKKTINNTDKKIIYNFFLKNKEIYKHTPITAKGLSVLLGYDVKDVPLIIKEVNHDKGYKNIIIGSNVGYYFVEKDNIYKAFEILGEKITKSNNELEYAYYLKEKALILNEFRTI